MPRSLAPNGRPPGRRSVCSLTLAVIVSAACGANEGGPPSSEAVEQAAAEDARTRPDRLASLLSVVAADSLEGRRTGTVGAHRAARFLAERLEEYGVEAAGDSAYHQWVPMARVTVGSGDAIRERLVLPSEDVSFDTIPEDRILRREANIVGILRGSDPEVADEAVIVGAHFDHVGIGEPVVDPVEGPDSIYNGADDDGSGAVAVLEIARTLARGTPPRRSVVFLLSTGEEVGLLGTRWYIDNPVVPMERTVADLQIEMIGRPDSLAGGVGRGWLTGYGRTTMGRQLAEAGSPIVPDPRPEQNFFFRSDNIAFARIGIPAHTLSSFNLHDDYHQPSDEVDEVDFQHMADLVDAAVQAVRFLADGPRPDWVPGGRAGLPDDAPGR